MTKTAMVMADPVEGRLNPFPTIKGHEEAWRVCRERFDVPVTKRAVKSAWISRRLASHLVGGACMFSEVDIYRWLRSTRRSADKAVAR